MKFNGARLSILLVLMLCSTAFPQTRIRSNSQDYNSDSFATAESSPIAVTAPKSRLAQDGPLAIESLSSGDVVTGSIPAPAIVDDCLLGETQYKVEYPGAPRKLVIELKTDQHAGIYARRGSAEIGRAHV